MAESNELTPEIERALAEGRSLPSAYFGVGYSALTEAEHTKAIRALEKCIGLDPTHVHAHQMLGIAHAETGALEAAIRAFGKCLALEGTGLLLGMEEENPYFHLGWALEEIGDVEKAEAAYRQGLARSPELCTLHLRLGRFLHLRGRWPEAATVYETALARAATAAQMRRDRRASRCLEAIRRNLHRAQARMPYEESSSLPWVRFARLK